MDFFMKKSGIYRRPMLVFFELPVIHPEKSPLNSKD